MFFSVVCIFNRVSYEQICRFDQCERCHSRKPLQISVIASGSLTATKTFWDFALQHLKYEKERFSSLRYDNSPHLLQIKYMQKIIDQISDTRSASGGKMGSARIAVVHQNVRLVAFAFGIIFGLFASYNLKNHTYRSV